MNNFHNRIIYLILFIILALGVDAQTSNQKKEILNELNSNRPGKGNVTIYEDESIKNVVGRPVAPSRPVFTDPESSAQYYKMRGFRIQAFSGNNQRTSRDEANRKKTLISNLYPEHEAVVLFESPFWRLRVGNFQTRAEAEAAMQLLKESFPAFGKEMYIVVDEVKITVN